MVRSVSHRFLTTCPPSGVAALAGSRVSGSPPVRFQVIWSTSDFAAGSDDTRSPVGDASCLSGAAPEHAVSVVVASSRLSGATVLTLKEAIGGTLSSQLEAASAAK